MQRLYVTREGVKVNVSGFASKKHDGFVVKIERNRDVRKPPTSHLVTLLCSLFL